MLNKLALQIGGTPILAPSGIPTGGTGSAEKIFSTIIFVLITIAILLSLAYLIWGAMDWIISRGDKQKIQQARMRIIYAIVGLIIALLSVIIVNAVGHVFNIPNFV